MTNNKKYSCHRKGAIAVLRVELEANKRGYIISRPTIECRYDLILDDGKQLYKVQVKYLNRKHMNGGLELKIAYRRRIDIEGKRHYTQTYHSDEIDLLLAYCPLIDKILVFTPKDFHNKKTIRVNTDNKKAPTYYEQYVWN